MLGTESDSIQSIQSVDKWILNTFGKAFFDFLKELKPLSLKFELYCALADKYRIMISDAKPRSQE